VSWQAVARKDFEDAVRSRWLLGLSVLFVLLVSIAVYLVRPAPDQTASSNVLVNHFLVKDGLVTTLIPLIALVMAYGSVVGERESGSLKLLLSLPHSRADVVFGKVFGRSGAIAAAIGIGFLLPGVLLLVLPRLNFRPGFYVGYVVLTVLLATVFVAIAVGFSAAMNSQRLAIGGAIGIYFVFIPLWGVIQFPLQIALQLGGGTPAWLPLTGQEVFQTLQLLNPNGSFKIVVNSFMSGQLYSAGARNPVRLQVAATLMLIVWILLPPLLGLLRFESVDL
jgi:ABC-2 type transport system permease protein